MMRQPMATVTASVLLKKERWISDRIRIFRPDGREYEVYTVPLGANPYRYAGELLRHRQGRDLSWQIETSGEPSARFTDAEI